MHPSCELLINTYCCDISHFKQHCFSFTDLSSTKLCSEVDAEDTAPFSVLQESNLTQETALIVLETTQALAQHTSVSFLQLMICIENKGVFAMAGRKEVMPYSLADLECHRVVLTRPVDDY